MNWKYIWVILGISTLIAGLVSGYRLYTADVQRKESKHEKEVQRFLNRKDWYFAISDYQKNGNSRSAYVSIFAKKPDGVAAPEFRMDVSWEPGFSWGHGWWADAAIFTLQDGTPCLIPPKVPQDDFTDSDGWSPPLLPVGAKYIVCPMVSWDGASSPQRCKNYVWHMRPKYHIW